MLGGRVARLPKLLPGPPRASANQSVKNKVLFCRLKIWPKIELIKETQVKHLNNFMLTMKNSGYPVTYRIEFLKTFYVVKS